ncbi:MAG: hypothetical protein JSW73_04895 [Candidatus Woesearchaeota archaeon]|nr:MAG: hypothetical protein JSW73_04895 [Candidatus Woesearchaeota archaeon]
MNRKKGFGVIGGVLLLIIIFLITVVVIWSVASQGLAGHPPVMHLNAVVVSSNYTNDCDIFLLNLLRYKDPAKGLTYGEKIILSKQLKESTAVGIELKEIIENDIIKRPLDCVTDCFEIIAQGEGDQEPFLSYAPCGKCDKRLSIDYCEAYLPEFNPEDEHIKVQLALEIR